MAIKQITSIPSASPEGKCVAKIREVQGKSLVLKQILRNPDLKSLDGWISPNCDITRNEDGSVRVTNRTDNNSNFDLRQYATIPAGRKILFLGRFKASSNTVINPNINNNNTKYCQLLAGILTDISFIATTSGTSTLQRIFYVPGNGDRSAGAYIDVYFSNFIDLTLMFGSGSEPSTVEEFKAMFPEDYYECNSGEIINSNINTIEVVGFNQWDEEWEAGTFDSKNGEKLNDQTYAAGKIRNKNYIKVFPNTTYYVVGSGFMYWEYDKTKTYIKQTNNTGLTPNNGLFTTTESTYYINFSVAETVYNHNICINISDPSRNGTYEPYKKSTLPLNISTLTGKLNGEGESVIICPEGLKSVGSVYDEGIIENGFMTKIIKRVGSVDLGTLSWTRKTSTSYGGEWSFFWTKDYNFKKPIIGTIATICDIYEGIPVYSFSSTSCKMRTTNKTCLPYTDSAFYVRDDSYTDSETFKAAMSGVLINYELITPLEYVLDTPILMEYNTDGGTEQIVFSENLLSTPLVADVDYFNTAIKHIQFSDETHCIRDERITGVDYIPTEHSTNVVTSSGVYNAISEVKAVYDHINTQLISALKYKGTIGTGGTVTSLPASHKVGDVYVVSTAGTYAGKACEVGDYIICKTAGTTANNAHWDVVNGENQVENKSASLAAAGSSATIATVDGTNITVTTPSTWTGLAKTGTITKVGNTTSGTVTVSSANNTASFGSAVTIGSVGGVDLKFTMPTNPIKGVKIFYGTCDTAAATADKAVVCPEFTEDDLENGTIIYVKFSYANSAAVADLTLNVNSTGAFEIKKVYNSALTNLTTAGEIRGTTYQFMIHKVESDGTIYWKIDGLDYNANENTVGYILRTNNTLIPTRYKFYRYRLLFTSPDNTELIPSNISTSINATAKRDVVQDKINPFGPILYYSTTTAINAGANPGTTYLLQQSTLAFGYSFNRTGAALTLSKGPVYLKCAPQTDGSAIIDADTPYVQTLPNTEDGKIYIYLGQSYDPQYIELVMCHPIYYYKNGAIRIWTGVNSASDILDGTSVQFVKGDGSFDSNSYLPENQAILSRMQDDATHRTVTDTDKTNWNNKQSTLISGSNIKTINNTSLLGSGNISIPSGKSAYDIWLDAGNTGTASDFLESLKGNSGYSGAAGELQVVNDLTTGGATAALSAEMGKLLADAIGAPTLIDLNEITAISNGYVISSTTKLWISRSDSKYILIPVENFYKVTVTANSSGVSALAWLKDTPIPVAGETPNYSEGTELWLQQANTIETYTVPTDAKFLYSFVAARYPAKVIGIKYNSTYNKNQFEPNLKTYSPITGSYINVTTYKWDNQNSTWSHIMIPNANYQSVTVKSNSSYGSRIAFLTNNDETAGSTPSYAENTSLYKPESGETNNYLIPSSTNWIYIYTGVDYGHLPESVVFYTDDSNSVNSIINTSSENDFEIVDKNKNPIVVFNNGHIKTLNFDSSKLVKTSNYTRRNFFSYNVNCTNFLTTNFTASNINYYDPIALYEDNAILYLPASYSNQGPKTKLIIYCKEGSTYMTEDHDSILTNPEVTRYFLYQGYAILAADGVPDGWKEALKIGERAVGNYVAVQSTLRAFEYVKNNYNIDCDNVFIFGYSQGGMYAENVIDNTDLPIRAAVLLSPALSMRYHQWDAPTSQTIDGTSYTKGARLNIARIFNFPEVTTNAQLLALEYDPDKVCGYDPWARNVDNPYDGFIKGTSVGTELWGLPTGVSLDSITMKKYTKCPTKIWVAENDNVLGVDITKVFVKAIRNTGQVADLQLFSTGEHHIQNYQTAIRTFVENGENVSLLPLYLDMAAWYYNFGGLELK